MKLNLASVSLLALALFAAPAEAQVFVPGSGGGGGGGGDITSPLGPTTAPAAAVAITDTGTAITGVTIPAGGQGLTGWLSAVHNDLTGGSFTVTASPFAPNGNTSSLSVGATTSNVALPAGAAVLVTNTGAQTAFIRLGTSNSVVATALNLPVLSGQTVEVAPGSNTWIAAIETGGVTTLRMSGGAGLFAGAGGGGSSSGGGGSVTQGTSPWVDNITQWASTNLGAPSAYGTSPGAVVVPGVNAFVTNTIAATVAQGTAANLNATVVGTGTFATQLTGATNNINNITGTISLPSLAATSTLQSNGNQKTQIVDGSGSVIGSTSNNLNVQCANCSGSGVSTADAATFTASASLFAGSGGFFQTTATSNPLTTGHQGMFQVTANRALFTNLRNASGAELGVAAAPLQVDLANTAANATAIKVTGTGGTFPVTGTFWQTTQPVSAASLPLPSGAATAANQRVTLAGTSDTSAQGVQGVTGGVEMPVVDSTVASAIASFAAPVPLPVTGVNTGGTTTNQHICGSHIFKHITTATDTQILPASGTTTIYVCDYSLSFGGTGNAYLESASSGTCGGLAQIDQAWYGLAGVNKTAANGLYSGLATPASARLCINTSAAVSVDVGVNYDQY